MLHIRTEMPDFGKRFYKRVKDKTPIPECCPYCEGDIDLINNKDLYNGKSYGSWPYAYSCEPCGAYVGLHPQTDLPLGTLANRTLRGARSKTKDLFHELQEQEGMSRSEAYTWLAEKMNISVRECHFGWFTLEQCKQAYRVLKDNLESSPSPR